MHVYGQNTLTLPTSSHATGTCHAPFNRRITRFVSYILICRPRGSAVGERLWSPMSVTDVGSATTRIHNQKCRMMRYKDML